MTALEEFKKEAAKNFLNSVLLIDDNIDNIIDNPTNIGKDPTEDFDIQDSEPEPQNTGPKVSVLKSQELISAFAKKAIHCTPYCFKDDYYPADLAAKSDVVILDWLLNEKNAEDILKNIIGSSMHKYRYFIIYTTLCNQAISDIENIKIDNIVCLHEDGSQVFDYRNSDTDVISCRVEVVDKNKVSLNDLPDQLISSFSRFNDSFMNNIILNVISSLRNNTDNLLNIYHKNLDAPILTHYLNLAFNDGTTMRASENLFSYIMDLISSDIRDVMSASFVQNKFDNCLINLFEEHTQIFFQDKKYKVKNEENIGIILKNEKEKFTEKLLENLDEDISKDVLDRTIIKLTEDVSDNKELSFLDCTKKCFNNAAEHQLRYGTILKDEKKKNYFLCVHPLCDCERIKNKASFTLLRLSKNNDIFNFVVKDNKEFVCLRIPQKITGYFYYKEFKANKDSANVQSSEKIFTSTDGCKFRWMCELKDIYTRVVMHHITTKYSRVGMDQFEWLRKKAN